MLNWYTSLSRPSVTGVETFAVCSVNRKIGWSKEYYLITTFSLTDPQFLSYTFLHFFVKPCSNILLYILLN